MNAENRGAGEPAVSEEIHRLLEQRVTFQAWLGKLDGLREKFRPEVAVRVEKDYRERLARVETELATHRAEIETAVAERRGEADALSDRRDAHAAELEEIELRHAVGELPERDWERRRRELEEALADLDGSIEAERKAITELDALLADLAERPAARGTRQAAGRRAAPSQPLPAPAAAAAGGGAQGAAEEDGPVAEAEPETVEEDEGEGEEGEDLLDELEFLDSLALEDAGRFDAVSRMLDENEEEGRRD